MVEPLKILYAFDSHLDLVNTDDFATLFKSSADWADERHVYSSLQNLGHDTTLYGVNESIEALIKVAMDTQPELVFATIESYQGCRAKAAYVTGIFELLGFAYTGASPFAMELCRDKALSKKVLGHHKIKVPSFQVFRRQSKISRLAKLVYPVIVKPLGLEASEGISKSSLVTTPTSCKQRIEFIHERFGVDVIVEQFINGREIYVGVLGNDNPKVLTPVELIASNILPEDPMFATYRAKWDEQYREKWGFRTVGARNLEEKVKVQISKTAKRIYSALHLRGYARIDFRLSDSGELYFLEANPNPALNKEDEFAMAAKLSGITYDELIAKIVRLGLQSRQLLL